MVNYAWIESSLLKEGWRLVEVLTRKSILEAGYRGERLIEPSGSWFPLKFPSGKPCHDQCIVYGVLLYCMVLRTIS